jgi:hypothetical protein
LLELTKVVARSAVRGVSAVPTHNNTLPASAYAQGAINASVSSLFVHGVSLAWRFGDLGKRFGALHVKSRLVINALVEQLRFYGEPGFQRLNGGDVFERPLWDQVVIGLHIAQQCCFQLSR